MSKKQERVITSLYLTKDMCEELDKKATRDRVSRNALMRSYIEKGLAVDGHKEGIDLIRRHIREEISNCLEHRMERIIKLIVKSGIVSAAGYFLNAEVLAELIPPSRQRELEDVLLESKKQGVVYFKLTDQELEEFVNNENKILRKYASSQ